MNNVSAAIVRHLSEYPFWTDKARRGLIDDIGEEGLKYVEQAVDFASNQEDLWLQHPLAEACEEVGMRVRARYPDLDEEAAKWIVTIAGYSWK
jgi:hypothetical protein